MNVGIFGVGAIGSAVAVALSHHQKLNLYYFNRSPKQVIQLKTESDLIKIPITLHPIDESLVSLDWLIICIKAHQYEEALPSIEKLINSNIKVAVIRNGLNLKKPLLHIVKEELILECMIDCPVQLNQDDTYTQLHPPIFTLPESLLAIDFSKLLIESEVSIKVVPDFKTENWKKICESASLGAILCLSGETCYIFNDPELIALYKALMAESIAVAKADGANSDDDFIDQMLGKLANYPAHKGSSMLTDRINGNPIELEAKNKVISDLGKKYRIDTPLNDMACSLLRYTNNK